MKSLTILDLSSLDLAIGGCNRQIVPSTSYLSIGQLAKDYGFDEPIANEVIAKVDQGLSAGFSMAEPGLSGNWCGTPAPSDAPCGPEGCDADGEDIAPMPPEFTADTAATHVADPGAHVGMEIQAPAAWGFGNRPQLSAEGYEIRDHRAQDPADAPIIRDQRK